MTAFEPWSFRATAVRVVAGRFMTSTRDTFTGLRPPDQGTVASDGHSLVVRRPDGEPAPLAAPRSGV
jgi:hypothetical protein